MWWVKDFANPFCLSRDSSDKHCFVKALLTFHAFSCVAVSLFCFWGGVWNNAISKKNTCFELCERHRALPILVSK